MKQILESWLSVILSWLAFFGVLFVKAMVFVGKWSPTITGLAGIAAICFTAYQWRKEHKKRKHK